MNVFGYFLHFATKLTKSNGWSQTTFVLIMKFKNCIFISLNTDSISSTNSARWGCPHEWNETLLILRTCGSSWAVMGITKCHLFLFLNKWVEQTPRKPLMLYSNSSCRKVSVLDYQMYFVLGSEADCDWTPHPFGLGKHWTSSPIPLVTSILFLSAVCCR